MSDPAITFARDPAITFRRVPAVVSASLRPERRVPLLLLLVNKCHGSGASWQTLQVLSWAVGDQTRMNSLIAARAGRLSPDRPIVRFEPALDRAITLALGLGFLGRTQTDAVKLTVSGQALVQRIEEEGLFEGERAVLATFAGKATRSEVSRILAWHE